jgi:hypothetical protein
MDASFQLTQQLQASGIPIAGVSQPSPGTFIVHFSGQETSDQISQANAIASNFVPAPESNLIGFKGSIMSDTTIPASSLIEIVKFVATLEDLINTPEALQNLWSAIKATDSMIAVSVLCSDSVPVCTKIESYASTFSIPLTSV